MQYLGKGSMVGKDNAVSICTSLYELCSQRCGQPQSIKDKKIIESFVNKKLNNAGLVGRKFIVDYIAWQFQRWVSGSIRIMPNMIFGATAIDRYQSSEDRTIAWDKLARAGIFRVNMYDRAGVVSVSLFSWKDYDVFVRRQGDPIRCIISGVSEDSQCDNCKSKEKCLLQEKD